MPRAAGADAWCATYRPNRSPAHPPRAVAHEAKSCSQTAGGEVSKEHNDGAAAVTQSSYWPTVAVQPLWNDCPTQAS